MARVLLSLFSVVVTFLLSFYFAVAIPADQFTEKGCRGSIIKFTCRVKHRMTLKMTDAA